MKDKYQVNKKNYKINWLKLNKRMLKFKEMINFMLILLQKEDKNMKNMKEKEMNLLV